MQFSDLINARHSSRVFYSTPVPQEKIDLALSLAKHSPSSSNIQPWRLYLLRDEALVRLRAALTTAATSTAEPKVPVLPEQFRHFRSDNGKILYGEGWGIPKDDTEKRREAVLRNYDFFGAPLAAIVCMDKRLSAVDCLSVGMYLQTFLLALVEQGVGSCVEASVVAYPEVIREAAGIPEEMMMLCGVALGYENKDMKVNKIRTERMETEGTTVFLE
ncbi:Nitroreductase-like protein [Mariannaea sp. PMI_226]|nr:Nitroreductase-like protein [Mariannaea sp. PMI_226]